MKKRKIDVMVAGHLCLDMIPRIIHSAKNIGDIFHPGKLLNVGECVLGTGGAVSNTGIALKKLGAKVCFCARVGNDEIAQTTISILRKNGDASGISVSGKSASSYSVVIAIPGIDRIFLHHTGTNDEFSSGDLDKSLLSECCHFHLGYPSLLKKVSQNDGAELLKIFKAAKSAGATTSLDMSLPDPDSFFGKLDWRRILERTLPYVDVFVPSFEEALFMLYPEKFLKLKKRSGGADITWSQDDGTYREIAVEYIGMGANVVVIKAGTRGIYLKTSDRLDRCWSGREIWCPAYKIAKIASATGAGDASIAGFLKAYLEGFSPEKCLKAAVCLGWQNVQAYDSVGGIRTWKETLSIIGKNMPFIDPAISAKRWKFDGSNGLWIS